MSKFFINRPIVAIVISILMVLIGAITILSLPIAQFPNIAPPEIQVLATYVGADAETLEQAVAAPIEQQMSGVDNMNYMYSLNATGNSNTTLVVDFDIKTDPNTDLILTQSRETQAASQLPTDVTNYGITVRKSVTAPLVLLALYSPHGTYDARFLANYAYINLNDPFTRLPGIGNVQIFGAGQYAMRLWVKPDQLAKLGITVPDVVAAIQAQNTVNPAGSAGGEPAPKGQEFTYSVLAQGRLVSPEEFGEIVVRETPTNGLVRVKDVARVELGAQDYSVSSRMNGDLSIAWIKRSRRRGWGAEADGKDEAALPAGHGLQHRSGPDSLGDRRHQGNCRNSCHRPHSCNPRGVHFLARLASYINSAFGRSGFARRHLYIFPRFRFLAQHAFALRLGPSHRLGRGRCHRRGGGS
jgi:multidrug efflux pump subunit AcrB